MAFDISGRTGYKSPHFRQMGPTIPKRPVDPAGTSHPGGPPISAFRVVNPGPSTHPVPDLRLIFLALPFLLLSSCNRPVPTLTIAPEAAVRQTAAALTLEAQLTGLAAGAPSTETPSPPASTAAPNATSAPANQTSPTSEGNPSETTESPEACDRAAFVQDVNVPDGTQFGPGESFEKTWRLKNVGSCEWDPNYSLVFVDGDAMGGPAAVTLTGTVVPPGEEVEITVIFKAPVISGTYRGNWKLRNPSGQSFGVGSDGSDEFWVEIEVVDSVTPTAFSHATNTRV
jgi:Ig-like domain from next to BRCA1 gene